MHCLLICWTEFALYVICSMEDGWEQTAPWRSGQEGGKANHQHGGAHAFCRSCTRRFVRSIRDDNTLLNDCSPSDLTSANILFQVSNQARRWSDDEIYLTLGKPITDKVETIDLSANATR